MRRSGASMPGIWRRAVVLGTLMMASVVSCTLVFAHFHHLDRAAGQPSLSHNGGAKWGAHYSTVAVAVISAIHHDKGEVHIVNTRNNGALPDLPPECVVELPSVINGSGARAIPVAPMPPAIRGLTQAVKA